MEPITQYPPPPPYQGAPPYVPPYVPPEDDKEMSVASAVLSLIALGGAAWTLVSLFVWPPTSFTQGLNQVLLIVCLVYWACAIQTRGIILGTLYFVAGFVLVVAGLALFAPLFLLAYGLFFTRPPH